MTRDDIYQAADEEADFNVAAEALGDKEELTVEDLRTLPGVSADMSDEDVLSLWKEVQEGSTSEGGSSTADQVAAAAGAESAVKTSRGYKLFDENGQELGDISKLSAEQLLSKSKIEYTANKTQHRKSLDELVRVAQFGHLNETKLSVAQRERDEAIDKLMKTEPQLKNLMQVNASVRYALTQFALNNDEPLKALIASFQKQMGAMPQEFQQAPSAVTSAPSPVGGQADAQALRVYYEEILPQAYAVADKYGAKHGEMKAAIDAFLNSNRTVTREKLTSYIEDEIPLLLENVGYRVREQAAPVSTDPKDNEIMSLKQQLAALQSGQNKVAAVKQLNARNKNIPGSGSRDSMSATAADGDKIPAEATKSREAFKKYLES